MKFIVPLLFLLFASCSGISLITPGDRASLYTDDFLTEIEMIKQLYAQGETDSALQRLRDMREEDLRPTEEALKRNLLGVIYFSESSYQQAIFQFDTALSNSRLDDELTAQIHLNLASSYFRMDQYDRSFSALERSDHRKLVPEERRKHHRLLYTLSRELERDREASIALIRYLGEREKISEIRNDPYFQELTNHFFRLSRREKLRVIESFEDEQNLAAGYMAYLEAERAYYRGSTQEAMDMLGWVERRFSDQAELSQVVQNFVYRLENFTQMNQESIGVVLPLSGERRDFGERALLGIDAALREVLSDEQRTRFQLHIVDSEGSGAIGAYRVNDLIEKHNVSAIIGGLFSTEAEKQYREARKRGVLFISLSQIHTSQVNKNHLLLEVPGSIESQVNRIFSEDMLETFGRRAAIIYPESSRGEAYINEFWRKAQLNDVEVSGVVSYDTEMNDFREPVQRLLGLYFQRNRLEEKELLEEVHSLERTHGVRRVQTLKPQIEFDWVFIPSYPMQALQIIPSFNYYDATNLKMIGGPSWRSRALLRESSRLGELFFIGDDIRPVEESFMNSFYETYNTRPRLIELRGFDAMNIVDILLGEKEYPSRDVFELDLRERGILKGVTGNWKLSDDDLWIKEMAPLKMRRGQITSVFEEDDYIQDEEASDIENDIEQSDLQRELESL